MRREKGERGKGEEGKVGGRRKKHKDGRREI